VLPAAISFAVRVAVGPDSSRRITVQSENFSETVTFDLSDRDPPPRHHWSNYVRGVALLLERAGVRLRGANLLIHSNVPAGAGLSSSAALEVSTALALLTNSEGTMEPVEIARLCQRAENEFCGARCGIMDHFTACHARSRKAILLDCRSLEARHIPLPPGAIPVVSNTMVQHALASGEYNRRREECEQGVRDLSRAIRGVQALRDVTPRQLSEFGCALDERTLRRCRHVVAENARVLAGAEALERGDLNAFGQLMNASHRSLRDDFEVSCPELDAMVESASSLEGVYGSRLTGGGFGGCAVSLVEAGRAEEFSRQLSDRYFDKTGIRCEVYRCSPADGAAEELV
jgi:galactokinase